MGRVLTCYMPAPPGSLHFPEVPQPVQMGMGCQALSLGETLES